MKFSIVFIILFLNSIGLFAQGVQPAGSGTETDPYQIANLDNLEWISLTDSSWASHFVQTADIDASPTVNWNGGEGWSPIGYGCWGDSPFFGTYNGQGHTIDGLWVNRPNVSYQGLFGSANGTTIANLGVTNIYINGCDQVGGLIGYANHVEITNCNSSGNVTGINYVGGLGGNNLSSYYYYNSSSVTVSGNCVVGGLCGRNVETYFYYNCTSGTVSGAICVGGLLGGAENTLISENYSTGNVIGNGGVGGLVGYCSRTGLDMSPVTAIDNCFSTGEVTGKNSVGGLIGSCGGNGQSNDYCYIRWSYSTGSVHGTTEVGGFLGRGNYYRVTFCFWNIETSNVSNGVDGGNHSQVFGLTTAEMQTLSTFTDVGWDFEGETANGDNDFWRMNSLWNNGYPYLIDNCEEIGNNDETEAMPVPTVLNGNYPNPFNPTTTISFSVKHRETATLEIFNIKGQRVKSFDNFKSGNHNVIWNGTTNHGNKVGSGIFFYRLKSESGEQIRKMLMLK
ncbi:MAG: T9SS type A sorting domain-containing protein [Candidatus Cloacimonetes bacterium]|nr:T9SS type A sorting domain-containing protein [Candidatus Cloacimonadota bacterium]